jgi:PAS domain S-box-containing protein
MSATRVAPQGGISLEDFRSLADSAPVMLWLTDASGECTFLNKRLAEFTGQDTREALGHGWLATVHPDDRDAAARSFMEANARRGPYELEHRVRTASGQWRWVIDAGCPRFDASGRFLGYAGSVTDIHERTLAERSLRAERDRLDLVVDASQLGLWHWELPFGELDWNARAKSHFGLPPDARVTIDTFYERMHPEDRDATRRAIDAALKERAGYDVEYRTIGLDGQPRWIRAIGRAQFDERGEARSFDGITVDVTERVRRTEELREADRRKDEFLAVLAHELRNPLAPIANGLALLDIAGERHDLTVAARASMGRQLKHLVRLVDDLLDVSRISRGKLELRRAPARLGDVVRNAVEIARPHLEGRGHALDVAPIDPDVELVCDATRLTQALSNLLHNAAKFTPHGGRIAISARADPREVEIRVSDNGIGIAAEMRERIFEMFTQVPRAPGEAAESGLGIGLALAHSLVRLHGGTLRADSAGLGKGAEFILTLPRHPG